MSGSTNIDRRSERRQATINEILAAAWDQVREHGLSGLAMRDLGERVGMRAQSLYSYFSSKHEIYDAMFLQGNEAFVEWMRAVSDPATVPSGPVANAHDAAHRYFEFCISDPVRYQLLFQRTIPDFIPSAHSYAVAQEAYDMVLGRLRALGITDSGVDLWTAVIAGLVAQQLSNEPGGDRWARLLDEAVDMLIATLAPQLLGTKPTRRT